MSYYKDQAIKRQEAMLASDLLHLPPVGLVGVNDHTLGVQQAEMERAFGVTDRLPVIQVEELTVENIELGACDCPACTAAIWDRSTGYQDLVPRTQRAEQPSFGVEAAEGIAVATLLGLIFWIVLGFSHWTSIFWSFLQKW